MASQNIELSNKYFLDEVVMLFIINKCWLVPVFLYKYTHYAVAFALYTIKKL